jgi:hypothetical protein
MICTPGFRLRFKLASMTCMFSLLNTRLISLADLLTLWLRLVVSSEERILGPCLRVFGIVEHPICSAERVLLWVEGKFWFRRTNRYKVVFLKNGSANLQIEQADDDWHLVPRQVLIEQMHYLDIKNPTQANVFRNGSILDLHDTSKTLYLQAARNVRLIFSKTNMQRQF